MEWHDPRVRTLAQLVAGTVSRAKHGSGAPGLFVAFSRWVGVQP
jgi:hypothetical protein